MKLAAAERFERRARPGGVGAIGVAVRIEVGDGDSEEVCLGEEGSNERDELPVEL